MPSYLQGHLAPVPDEIDAVDLPVSGELPPELTGRYFRNGPNPLPGQDPGHWLAGHGMLHGLRLREGRAEWYRNRWVRTKALVEGAQMVSERGVDLSAVTANTSVVRHADRVLAMVESGLPYEMDLDLNTRGACDFGGRLTTAMTAHPKELDGELHFFGYGFAPPYLTYHRLDADGELVESRAVEVAGPTMMHDFAVTERHVVWLDLPIVFDLTLAGRGMPYRWDERYGARLGVMPRAGGPVRWHEIDPCYVFHVGNAHEDADGHVVLDAVRYRDADVAGLWRTIGGDSGVAERITGGTLHRWTLGDAVKEEQLDDRIVEFPTINDLLTGREARYRYTVTGDAVVKYDLDTGGSLAAAVGGRAGEAVYVPRGDEEDDGWLLSINAESLLVHDARDLRQVAAVRLPRRVPVGFHGTWLPDE